MFRKSFACFVLAYFLCLVSTSYGIVIGDFEDESFDEWWTNTWDTPGTTFSQSTTGVTLGDYSLKIDVGGSGWKTMAAMDLTPLHEAFLGSDTVELDLTYDPNDWPEAEWAQVILVINSQNAGWQQLDRPDTDDVNPGFTSGWDPANFPEVQTRHITWDITITHAALAKGGGAWYELFLISNFGISGTGAYYIDNVQLISHKEASDPMPTDNATEVEILPTLSWDPGQLAASHRLYLGTDINDVNYATPESHENVIMVNTDEAGYTVPDYLAFESTFYWRVDEVNDTEVWKGPVWTLTTGNFEVIDNFEHYNDDRDDPSQNRIFEAWVDSYDPASDSFPGSQVGNFNPPYAEQGTVFTGFQSMPLFYNNDDAPFYSEATRIFESPQDWTTANDGQIFDGLSLRIHGRWESPGTFNYDPDTGQYTVIGSGADIWNAEDQFHYVLQLLPGDGSIVAKVESVENTHAWAKAGVMIREGLSPDAAMFGAIVAPSERVQFLYRNLAGENANDNDDDWRKAGSITLPYWVKITRQGNILNAQHSADGQTWLEFAGGTLALSFFEDVYIGLVVTSHVDAGTPCEAVFSNVTVTGTANPLLTESTDALDMPTNVGDNLYVTLQDNVGGSATVNHPDDPNAIEVNNWQEWTIGLSDLIDQGVDLTQITSMALGIGNKDNSIASGIGKVFVDDIRLYLQSPN